jgi:hypothetical protein
MTLQELQWAVAVLVGITVVLGTFTAIIKFFIKVAQDFSKLTALHPRLDLYFREQAELKLEVREIKTFLRVHPTLRFRIPDRGPAPAPAAGPQAQDMFADPGE